jgi:caffeoyl-CoA O-methyltransferase
MALALPSDGRVITCDVNVETNAIARRYAAEAGVIDRIDYRLAPALETVARLEGPFDIVFIDADKVNYVNYYEATLPLLADDGVMLVDNALSSGDVVDPANAGESARAIHALNERIRADDRVENVLLTVRDGINLVRRRRD